MPGVHHVHGQGNHGHVHARTQNNTVLPGGVTPNPTPAINPAQSPTAIDPNLQQFVQQQGALFASLNQGNHAYVPPSAQGDFPTPSQYRKRHPGMNGEPQPGSGFEAGASDLLNSGLNGSLYQQDKLIIKQIIDELRKISPQLDEIMRNPKLGKGLRVLLIMFATMILRDHQKVSGFTDRIAKMNGQGGTMMDLNMAGLASGQRNLSRSIETGTNVLKLLFDTISNILRNIRS